MNGRAVILLVFAFAALILAALPEQVNAATAVTLNLAAQSETTVSLSWTLSGDAIPGYDIIVGYELFMSSTGINGFYSKIWSTVDNQRLSTSVDGLSPDTSYYFYLVANGLSGNYNSNTINMTTTGVSYPGISILSPTNTSYAALGTFYTIVPLTFEANVSLSWVGYSLDGRDNITASNGTSIELPGGSGNLTVYANDTVGNWAIPQTVYYTVTWNEGARGPPATPFPLLPIAAFSVAVATVVIVVSLEYRMKGKRQKVNAQEFV